MLPNNLAPLKRDIMAKKAVMQRPILPGTRSGETKTEKTELRAIMVLGRKVCIRWNVYTRVNSSMTSMALK